MVAAKDSTEPQAAARESDAKGCDQKPQTENASKDIPKGPDQKPAPVCETQEKPVKPVEQKAPVEVQSKPAPAIEQKASEKPQEKPVVETQVKASSEPTKQDSSTQQKDSTVQQKGSTVQQKDSTVQQKDASAAQEKKGSGAEAKPASDPKSTLVQDAKKQVTTLKQESVASNGAAANTTGASQNDTKPESNGQDKNTGDTVPRVQDHNDTPCNESHQKVDAEPKDHKEGHKTPQAEANQKHNSNQRDGSNVTRTRGDGQHRSGEQDTANTSDRPSSRHSGGGRRRRGRGTRGHRGGSDGKRDGQNHDEHQADNRGPQRGGRQMKEFFEKRGNWKSAYDQRGPRQRFQVPSESEGSGRFSQFQDIRLLENPDLPRHVYRNKGEEPAALKEVATGADKENRNLAQGKDEKQAEPKEAETQMQVAEKERSDGNQEEIKTEEIKTEGVKTEDVKVQDVATVDVKTEDETKKEEIKKEEVKSEHVKDKNDENKNNDKALEQVKAKDDTMKGPSSVEPKFEVDCDREYEENVGLFCGPPGTGVMFMVDKHVLKQHSTWFRQEIGDKDNAAFELKEDATLVSMLIEYVHMGNFDERRAAIPESAQELNEEQAKQSLAAQEGNLAKQVDNPATPDTCGDQPISLGGVGKRLRSLIEMSKKFGIPGLGKLASSKLKENIEFSKSYLQMLQAKLQELQGEMACVSQEIETAEKED
ncbi:hypothetical protein ABW21_db0204342 [Orbilia brochopaga]|nr:hypothetical protein ABW21_db0204342 [Drechslerella brochopaga]